MNHDKGVCYWPPGPNADAKVKNMKFPNPKTWSLYSARILKGASTYDEARKFLVKAEYQSDLNSESEDASTPKRPRHSQRKRPHVPSRDSGPEESEEEQELVTNLSLPPIVTPSFHLASVSNTDETPPPTGVFTFNQADVDALNQDNMSEESFSASGGVTSSHLAGTSSVQGNNLPQASSGYASPVHHGNSSQSNRTGLINEGNQERSVELDLLLKIAEDTSFIKKTLGNLEKRVENLEKGLESHRQGSISEHEKKFLTIPFSSIPAFMEFDTNLSEDDMRLLKNEMLSFGGDSIVELIGRVLRKVMIDQLARSFSLWGHKENHNFSTTNTWKVLKGAVMSCRKLTPDEKAVEKACMNWFRHAGDRLKSVKGSTNNAN